MTSGKFRWVRGLRLPAQRSSRTALGHATSALVLATAGLLITVSALAARGSDLRSDRNLSLRELIIAQGQRNTQLEEQIEQLRAKIAEAGEDDELLADLQPRIASAALVASTTPVVGPGVRVQLADAPPDVKPAGVSEDALVVHQQDIQEVVNALWSGGAEAITIQGERVIATTGIKCVGNTVVLHGVPYAPPYVIEAIGDPAKLTKALDGSSAVTIFRQYVNAYGLGFSMEKVGELDMPGFTGTLGLGHARRGSD